MKRFLFLMVVSLLLFSLGNVALASKSPQQNSDDLTETERMILLNEVGLSEYDLTLFPVEQLREFIAIGAKKLSNKHSPTSYDLKNEGDNNNKIGTMALTEDDITLYGAVLQVASDKPNNLKFYIYGTFTWMVDPFWTLTDKYSIGYPVTNEWYLPTKNGKIDGHANRICYYFGYQECINSNEPSDHSIGSGVAAAYDLKADSSAHIGLIGQYVYTTRQQGASNVVFRYGHRLISGKPSVSIYPDIGLAITPSTQTETLDYIIEFEWGYN